MPALGNSNNFLQTEETSGFLNSEHWNSGNIRMSVKGFKIQKIF